MVSHIGSVDRWQITAAFFYISLYTVLLHFTILGHHEQIFLSIYVLISCEFDAAASENLGQAFFCLTVSTPVTIQVREECVCHILICHDMVYFHAFIQNHNVQHKLECKLFFNKEALFNISVQMLEDS